MDLKSKYLLHDIQVEFRNNIIEFSYLQTTADIIYEEFIEYEATNVEPHAVHDVGAAGVLMALL